MDFSLRCNSLKCRTQLIGRAVVTTCSHVFCNQCSDSLGLTAPATHHRTCPACETSLPQPDDAVSTSLQPTEDYKTSVLSGLSPTTIMECAGRALAFWSYQSTQEIVYQEYLAKTLTEKYSTLNVQMDKVINDANSELNIVNQKLNNLQIDSDRLKSENTNLVAAYRDKQRKHQQTQELYDRLKRKEMTAATQSAAFESVDEVLGHPQPGSGYGVSRQPQYSASNVKNRQQDFQPRVDHNGIEQVHTHQRSGSMNSGGSGGGRGTMPPPPPPALYRPGRASNNLGHGKALSVNQPEQDVDIFQENANPTPSNHRSQLGQNTQSARHLGVGTNGHPAASVNRSSRNPISSQRQPFASISGNTMERPNMGNYGLSAGLRVGRQQSGSGVGLFSNPDQENAGPQSLNHFSQPQRFPRDSGTFF